MPAGEVGKDLVLVAALGTGNTGLATVGYTLKNADGTTKQDRTTTGVTEIGGGWYRVRALAALLDRCRRVPGRLGHRHGVQGVGGHFDR
jgi:hypothetical protein